MPDSLLVKGFDNWSAIESGASSYRRQFNAIKIRDEHFGHRLRISTARFGALPVPDS